MIDVEKLLRIEHRGEPVLTTKQLAAFYGCSTNTIRHNFADNKEQFEEGVHYFKLEGEQLRAFKAYVGTLMARYSGGKSFHTPENSAENSAYIPMTRLASSIVLWTKQGCVRHCKMLNTETAWAVFNLLEINYFDGITDIPDPFQVAPRPGIIPVNLDNIELLALIMSNVDKYGAATLERILDKWFKWTNR